MEMKKERKRRLITWIAGSILSLSLLGCQGEEKMKNGYYTAEMSDYDFEGYKEYVCMLVRNNKIIAIEFNGRDQNGFIKAWDNEYMKKMKIKQGTYPNEYTRLYSSRLIESQDISKVDMISGASTSGGRFVRLVTAAIEQAKKGEHQVVIIEE